jgi:hypothetical protein
MHMASGPGLYGPHAAGRRRTEVASTAIRNVSKRLRAPAPSGTPTNDLRARIGE